MATFEVLDVFPIFPQIILIDEIYTFSNWDVLKGFLNECPE